MAASVPDIKALADRAALLDLVHRYAATIDSRDLDGLVECFAADAVADYDGGVRLEGRVAIRAFMEKAFNDGIGPDRPSTHLMANTLIDLAGDEAVLRTTAIACLTNKSGKVVVRGLRYTDRCIRDSDGWRFQYRRHEADWGLEAGAQFVNRIAAFPVQ